MAAKADIGGYVKRFVDPLPDELVCFICHCAAREPHQITCCGTVYCKTCLNQQEQTKFSRCHTCRKAIFSFHDKVSERRIKARKVFCDNEEGECKWVGELSQLETHVAECGFTKVSCTNNCSQTLFRKDLDTHLQLSCPLRQYECPHCKERGQYQTITTTHLQSSCPLRQYKCPHCKETGQYQTITTTHLERCPEQRITCPNVGCSSRTKRRNMPAHLDACVKCQYSIVGCSFRGAYASVEKHTADCMEQHLNLAIKATAKLEEMVAVPPQVFKLPNFKAKKARNVEWYSPSFYTHPGGYKMCLSVFTNGTGDGENTHISLFIHLLPGRNDKSLLWPFKGDITIELLNHIEDATHFKVDIPYEQAICDAEMSKGLGYTKFVSHAHLYNKTSANRQYLKDDCLYFRVAKITVDRANKPWLTCTRHND